MLIHLMSISISVSKHLAFFSGHVQADPRTANPSLLQSSWALKPVPHADYIIRHAAQALYVQVVSAKQTEPGPHTSDKISPLQAKKKQLAHE